MNFNPLPPHGGRLHHAAVSMRRSGFQSTPSAWRETVSLMDSARPSRDFNPLPPHGGRRLESVTGCLTWCISIHSLRMEGDAECAICTGRGHHFNPLPPHGGRHTDSCYFPVVGIFQSTPSAWRETWGRKCLHLRRLYFNPLPPHGGRLWTTRYYGYGDFISIHSLRMEGDSRN